MATGTAPSKVTAAHLCRAALLYIRQSTLKQVIRNTESAIRQYDLRGRAIALGWAADQITVIDIDQSHSGASAADREGFQHLVAEVSLGRAGIVLGLECSRLAARRAARRPPVAAADTRTPGNKVNWRSIIRWKKENYTNIDPDSRLDNLITAEPPGEAASQKTRCDETRDAPAQTYAVGDDCAGSKG
jgi:hypothetical protein